jgi:hypothetical protein
VNSVLATCASTRCVSNKMYNNPNLNMLELNQSGLSGNLGLHNWMSEPSSW